MNRQPEFYDKLEIGPLGTGALGNGSLDRRASARSAATRRLASLSLRTRVSLIFGVSLFVISCSAGWLIGQFCVETARARVGQSLTSEASRIADRIGGDLVGRQRELHLVASLDLLHEGRSASPQDTLETLRRDGPGTLWVAFADRTGKIVAATDPALGGAEVAPFVRHAPLSVVAGPSSNTVVHLEAPVRQRDGSVNGMLYAALGPLWLRDLLAGMPPALRSSAAGGGPREAEVVDGQDMVVAGSPALLGRHVTLDMPRRARAGFAGSAVEDWPDGKYLTGVAVVGNDAISAQASSSTRSLPADLRLTVLVREPLDAALAPAYALQRTILLTGTALAAALALVGWVVAGWLTSPLRRIALVAERLQRGEDVDLPRERGPAEIASLVTSLRVLITSVSRKQIALDEMEEIALRDPLTGLLNRHGLRTQLRRVMREVRLRGAALLIFVVDLDGFKAVNDRLGHAGGDEVLRLVGRRLSNSVRPEDLVARVGGDEFILALRAPHGFSDTTAREIAQRALAAVDAPYFLEATEARIGCSLGGACWPDHVDPVTALDDEASIDDVLRKADAALYEVKRNGKGQVLLYGEQLTFEL